MCFNPVGSPEDDVSLVRAPGAVQVLAHSIRAITSSREANVLLWRQRFFRRFLGDQVGDGTGSRRNWRMKRGYSLISGSWGEFKSWKAPYWNKRQFFGNILQISGKLHNLKPSTFVYCSTIRTVLRGCGLEDTGALFFYPRPMNLALKNGLNVFTAVNPHCRQRIIMFTLFKNQLVLPELWKTNSLFQFFFVCSIGCGVPFAAKVASVQTSRCL